MAPNPLYDELKWNLVDVKDVPHFWGGIHKKRGGREEKKKKPPSAAQIWAHVSNGSHHDDSRLQPTQSERDLNKWNKEGLLPQVWLHCERLILLFCKSRSEGQAESLFQSRDVYKRESRESSSDTELRRDRWKKDEGEETESLQLTNGTWLYGVIHQQTLPHWHFWFSPVIRQ